MSIEFIHNSISNKLSGANGPDFLLYEEVGSTNDVLKDLYQGKITSGFYGSYDFNKKMQEGFSVISLSQSSGKGRSGRKFFSPPNCSIYLSIFLQPDMSLDDSLLITPMAAAAVQESVKCVCNVDAGIKWVNDLYHDGKKICGILTEASLIPGSCGIDYVVLGIGINVFTPDCELPEDIKDIYGTIYSKEYHYNESIISNLTSEVISRIMGYYADIKKRTFMATYRNKMFLIGNTVTYFSGNKEHLVKVLDVDEDAHLIVVDEEGVKHIYKDGEVRLKMLRN